jgi:hypothetical protein
VLTTAEDVVLTLTSSKRVPAQNRLDESTFPARGTEKPKTEERSVLHAIKDQVMSPKDIGVMNGESKIGLSFGHARPYELREPISDNLPGVPPPPDKLKLRLGIEDLKPVRIPNPPLIDDTLSENHIYKTLCNAYEGAVFSRYKTRPFINIGKQVDVYDPGSEETIKIRDPKLSKLWAPMMEAAHLLKKLEISPFAWAAFSIDVWDDSEAKHGCIGKPPGIRWVWSPNRVRDRNDWFDQRELGYRGGATCFVPSHRELLRKWNMMHNELYRSGMKHSQEIVERWFPGDKYMQMVEKARKDTQREQARLDERLEMGDWLWD